MIVTGVVSSPRTTLHYIYYAFAAIILLFLAFATELELHSRHLQKAYIAGGLFALIALLFILGEKTLFQLPTISNTAMTTSAAAVSK
jgi:hypothetical protein